MRPPPPVRGDPAGANGDEPSTINRCPVAASQVARGSPPSRRAMPSVRTGLHRAGLTEQVCVAGIDQNQVAADAPVRWWGKMAQNEISSCNVVRASDLYFRLNVVCEPTGMTVTRGQRRRSWVCRVGSPGDQCPCNRLMSYITGQRTVGKWLAPSRRHKWGTLVEGGAALRGACGSAGRVVRRMSAGRERSFPDDVIMARCLSW